MISVLELLASALICPVALLYMFLLNDRWRGRPLWRWLLLLLCGPCSVFLAGVLAPLPILPRVFCLWAPLLLLCWRLSAVRDPRFLFTAATGLLFTYLSAAVCSMAAVHLGVHRALLRLVLDSLLLLLGFRFFRPPFLQVFHAMDRGWLIFSLMPVSLMGIFFSLLITPGYLSRYILSYVQGFTYLLALLSLVYFWVSLYFFQKLGTWQEGEVGSAVLSAQVSALTEAEVSVREAEERRRVLRHDLRHYLRILSSCLRAGDDTAALNALEALEESLQGVGVGSEKEEAGHER